MIIKTQVAVSELSETVKRLNSNGWYVERGVIIRPGTIELTAIQVGSKIKRKANNLELLIEKLHDQIIRSQNDINNL